MNNGKGIEDAGGSYASLLQNILQKASVSRTIRCWIQELSLFIARMKQTLHERKLQEAHLHYEGECFANPAAF